MNTQKSLQECPSVLKAFDFIRENLEKGVWHPHERMPTLKTLAAATGVSDRTVVKAVAQLKAQGFVNSVKGGALRAGSGNLPDFKTAAPSTAVWQMKRAALEKDILEGVYAQAGRLPSFKELQARYGTCFATMRKILRSMLADNVVHLRGKRYELRNVLRKTSSRKIIFITNSVKAIPFSALNPHEFRVIDTLEHECVRREMRLDIVEIEGNDTRSLRKMAAESHGPVSITGYVLDVWDFAREEIRLRYIELLTRLAPLKKPVAIIDEAGDFVLPGQFSTNALFQVFRIEGKSAGGRMARLLLGLGHRSIAFISAYHQTLWSGQRLEGIREQFAKAGLAHGVHACVANEMSNLLPSILRVSGFNDKLIKKILSVGRTEIQAQAEFRALEQFRKSGQKQQFKSADIQALQNNLACLEGMVTGRADRELIESVCSVVFDTANIIVGSLFFAPLYEQALRTPGVTAWICVNDTTALIAMPFLKSKGITIPRDLFTGKL
jgi:DNA-binding LacI/PurR family transcriptional regulator